MNFKGNYKVKDCLRDNGFVCYALNISSEAGTEWESLLKEYSNSALADEAKKAKEILTGECMTHTLEPEECEKLKRSILASLHLAY